MDEPKTLTKSPHSGADAPNERSVRGFVAALIVFVILFGVEIFLILRFGVFTNAGTASGSFYRGVGELVAAQLTLVSWVYYRFSRPPRNRKDT